MDRRIALVAVDAQWRDPNGTFFSFSYGIEKLRASIVATEDLAAMDLDDVLVAGGMGAYTFSESTRFNGFEPPAFVAVD